MAIPRKASSNHGSNYIRGGVSGVCDFLQLAEQPIPKVKHAAILPLLSKPVSLRLQQSKQELTRT
jgi:hypothetical protein